MPDYQSTDTICAPSTLLLRADGVEFGYSSSKWLQIDTLEVASRSVVGLLGPNGAGKSTLLRILAGLLRPSAGSVSLCGQPLASLSPSQRALRLAWVPQRSETPFEWSVWEMVAAGRHPHLGMRLKDREIDRISIRWAMDRVGLSGLEERPVGTLSGGEWQRAQIARALAQEPSLLLLDEPAANLDLSYQRQIYELLKELCVEKGIGVLAADHHVDLLAQFCDRLILMDDGKIAAQGPVEDVLRGELLERVYRTPLRVETDPATKRPFVRWRFPQV